MIAVSKLERAVWGVAEANKLRVSPNCELATPTQYQDECFWASRVCPWLFSPCGCAQAAQGLEEGRCVSTAILWRCGVGHACGFAHSCVAFNIWLRLTCSLRFCKIGCEEVLYGRRPFGPWVPKYVAQSSTFGPWCINLLYCCQLFVPGCPKLLYCYQLSVPGIQKV